MRHRALSISVLAAVLVLALGGSAIAGKSATAPRLLVRPKPAADSNAPAPTAPAAPKKPVITPPSGGNAQQGGAQIVLTVTPMRIEAQADPGETITREIGLTNSGAKPVAIESSAMDFVAGDKAGQPRFLPNGAENGSMSKWIKIEPAKFELEPTKTTTVTVTIAVPKDAEPGGHYAAALFGSAPGTGGQTAIVAKVGTLLLLTVGGDVRESGSVTLDAPRLLEAGPVTVGLTFANNGNVHVKPAAVVRVSRLWGKQVAELRFPEQNVLPRSSRESTATWKDVPRLGVFVAQAEAVYGSGHAKALSTKRYIFVLPWRVTLAGLALFALGVATALLIGRLGGRGKRTAEATPASSTPNVEATSQPPAEVPLTEVPPEEPEPEQRGA